MADRVVDSVFTKNSLKKLIRQFGAYLVTGGLAFVADAGTLYFLNSRFGVFYLYAAAAGFAVGLFVNYFLSLFLVFHASPSMRDFLAVMFIGLAGLALTEFGLYVGHGLLHLPVLFTKCIVAGLVLLWNFAMRKLSIYRD